MNQQIRELAEQAGLKYYNWSTNESNIIDGEFKYPRLEDYAKFAELIVKECAELSVNSQYANTKSEYYEGFNEALVYVGNKIKEHFGVEE